MKPVYIQAADQISLQAPLSEAWMKDPIRYDVPYARAVDPDFKQWLTPAESRRLGKILKRAWVTAQSVSRKTGVEHPDAILVGTGLGCMENTERFLEALCRDGESLLSPTHFMQSTHNTIASLLALRSHTHGYNITYSHKDVSFDQALLDAWTQFRIGNIRTALVGGYDELTPSYFTLLERIGYMGGSQPGTGSETAVALLLSMEAQQGLCELVSMRMLYRPTEQALQETLHSLLDEAQLTPESLSAVMTGVSGREAQDAPYHRFIQQWFPEVPTLRYKQWFGLSYTASAYAVYAAAHCLDQGFIPDGMYYGPTPPRSEPPQTLLLLNQSEDKEYSLIILRALCGH